MNSSGIKHGEKRGGFMIMWGWIWTYVGMDFCKDEDVAMGRLFLCTMKNLRASRWVYYM